MRPHDDGTETEHGFVSLFPAAGGLGVVWLDGRGYAQVAASAEGGAAPAGAAGHGGGEAAQAAGGQMSLRYALFPGSRTGTSERTAPLA